MQILLKKVTIIDLDGKHNKKTLDILIDNGTIAEIKKNIKAENAKVIQQKGLCVSVGWIDVGTQVCDPGFEQREDLESVAAAAAAGGFTSLAVQPNTLPAVQSKSQIHYLQNKSKESVVDFLPIGAVSKDLAGEDITEMIDMHYAGAVGFSDGKKSIQDSGLMMRALQYVLTFDGVVLNQPYDKHIAGKGQIHEGLISTTMGLKGIPAIAEEIMVQRDIFLAEYTNSRVHISNISSKGSVDLIKVAKEKGIQITASVAVMNLAFDDTKLEFFDTNYKVFPPLREKSDQNALKEGLRDGTIDFISSNHVPWEEEHKSLEFPYADFGVISLQTAFSLSKMSLDTLNLEEVVEKWTINPRKILGVEIPKISKGEKANLTLFFPEEEYVFNKKDIHSKSQNTPLIGKTLFGKILGVINGNKTQINF